jgi:hypothetical protein
LVAAQRGHRVRRAKVAPEAEEAGEGAVQREAGQDYGVGDVGVQDGQGERLRGAERVPDIDGFGEPGALGAGQGSLFELGGEGVQGGYFEPELDFVDGLAVGGLASAEAVPGECRVASGEGLRDVGVVVVGVRKVPVAVN